MSTRIGPPPHRLLALLLTAACALSLVACALGRQEAAPTESSQQSQSQSEANPRVPTKELSAAVVRPRLILLVAIDQLMPGRIDSALPGGLGRLMRTGRVYTEAALAHAIAETCPGHATILSGRYPGPSGIPANRYIDPSTGDLRYCIVDPSDEALVIGGSTRRSPHNLRVDTLGDWMKAANSETKVFAVSAKDRAAVTLGGQGPDGAYWFNRSGQVGFTTSLYYQSELPSWVSQWHGADPSASGYLSGLPQQWEHPSSFAGVQRADDYPEESDRFSRVTAHPLRDDDLTVFANNLYHSPFMDDVTLAFTKELVIQEGLGNGPGPDLLALSLSATDLVGHYYGPESVESRDSLLRTDRALGRFLDFLDERFGTAGVLIVLTSDHGVLSLPGWLVETGRSKCPVKGGRQDEEILGAQIFEKLHLLFGEPSAAPAKWLHYTGRHVTVNRAVAAERGVSVEHVVEVLKRELEAHPVIRHAWTRAEILEGALPLAERYRRSFDVEKSGDVILQLEPTCLLTSSPYGTTHGSPYAYDRDVPLIFSGPGVEPGSYGGRAETVDIAPTLAALIGLAPPDDLDGRVLFSPR